MKLATISRCLFFACTFLLFTSTSINAQCVTVVGTGAGALPDRGTAGCGGGVFGTPIEMSFDFSGLPADAVSLVEITDLSMTHSWVGDIQVALSSPSGAIASILNKPGSTTPTGCGTNADLTSVSHNFSDGGTLDFTADAAAGGVFACSGAGCDYVPEINAATTPLPTPETLADLAGFNGTAEVGTWTLSIWDTGGGDTGSVDSASLMVCTGPLPVELSSFTGSSHDKGIDLTWTTLSETNNAGFEVQMQDGSDWTTLSFVEGNGTTLEAQNYSFNVRDIDYGSQTFRLKQVDFDGAFEFSDELEIVHELATGYSLSSFYPNPFNPSGSFDLLVAESQNVNVEVYNMVGQRVKTLFQGEMEGQQRYRIEFNAGSGIPSGNYLIQVFGDTFQSSSKVSLVK